MVLAAQLGSSRLCGDGRVSPAGGRRSRSNLQTLTADALLLSGPRGGPGSAQEKRYRRIQNDEVRLKSGANTIQDNPESVHKALSSSVRGDVSNQCVSEVQGRLGSVVMDKLRRKFLETSLAHSRSNTRVEKMKEFNSTLEWGQKNGCPL